MPYLANPEAESTGIRVSTSPALQLTTVRPNLVLVNIEPGFSPECVHSPVRTEAGSPLDFRLSQLYRA